MNQADLFDPQPGDCARLVQMHMGQAAAQTKAADRFACYGMPALERAALQAAAEHEAHAAVLGMLADLYALAGVH